jgi:AraC-like DNA-binding protein
METKQLYLNKDLKVSNLAEALGTNKNAVSACINENGSSFSQLVNDYRLEYAKNMLRQSPDMKIASIALESGFTNERSFFRAFKAATGTTPKDWVAQQQTQ